MKLAGFILAALFAAALVAPGQDKDDADALVAEIERLTERLAKQAAKQRAPAGGPLQRRIYDVTDLTAPLPYRTQRFADLRSSWDVPPKKDGPDQFLPAFEIDALIELIRQTCEQESWDSIEGAGIEPKNARLFVSTVPRVHKAIEHLLAAVRKGTDRRVAVEICAVRLEDGEAKRLDAHSREIDADLAKALLARGVRASLSFAGHSGQGFAGRRGRTMRYVADFDVSIAKQAGAADPIPHELFAGLAASVLACRDERGHGALVQAQLSWTAAKADFATHETPHGKIDLPRLDVTRTSSTFWVPLSKPVLVGGSLAGERPIVFLLTVRPPT